MILEEHLERKKYENLKTIKDKLLLVIYWIIKFNSASIEWDQGLLYKFGYNLGLITVLMRSSWGTGLHVKLTRGVLHVLRLYFLLHYPFIQQIVSFPVSQTSPNF